MLLKTELMKTQDPWQNKKKKDKKNPLRLLGVKQS